MIPRIVPDKFELEAAIVYCFNSKNQLLALEKPVTHILYPGLCGIAVSEKINPGENKFNASKRGINEETSNDVDLSTIIYSGKSFPTCHHIRATGQPIIFLAHIMLCLHPIDTILISDEHKKYYWVDGFDILADKLNCIPDAVDNFIECIPFIKKYKPIKT